MSCLNRARQGHSRRRDALSVGLGPVHWPSRASGPEARPGRSGRSREARVPEAGAPPGRGVERWRGTGRGRGRGQGRIVSYSYIVQSYAPRHFSKEPQAGSGSMKPRHRQVQARRYCRRHGPCRPSPPNPPDSRFEQACRSPRLANLDADRFGWAVAMAVFHL